MNVTILVVDDEPELREMLARHFRFLGYQVETAGNGREALAQLATKRINIVITDIMMPVMDGPELLDHIRRDHPMVRTIVITGYVTLDNAMTCMRRGAETMVFKPIEDFAELEKAVATVVANLQRWIDILRDLQQLKQTTRTVAG